VAQKAHLLIVMTKQPLASLARAFRLEGHEAAVCDNATKLWNCQTQSST